MRCIFDVPEDTAWPPVMVNDRDAGQLLHDLKGLLLIVPATEACRSELARSPELLQELLAAVSYLRVELLAIEVDPDNERN